MNLDDLMLACEFVSSGESSGFDCGAYVDKTTGAVHMVGEGMEDEVPDHIDDLTLFAPVPRRRDMDLGSWLAIAFAAEHLADRLDDVRQAFRRSGAYAKFRSILMQAGQYEAWGAYEQAALERELQRWCEANDFVVVR
ncbi:hypothetical protein ACQQ2N_06105 [Dokdonella sp. MW10]|uniref:hypothetical protein n=1 Tax=Dokdonella sp. MW10 TaxID=2992926 RepID=UPI003F8137EC